jgi:hypothetical protein
MLTIACVLWQGEFRGRNYTHEHVRRLERMCRKWMNQDFEFVCLTNAPSKSALYKQISLEHPDILVGWWSKLELFNGQFRGRVLYLDLDNFICGSLDAIADDPGCLDFAPPLGKPSTDSKITKGVVTRFQSSVIVWDGKDIHLNVDLYTFEEIKKQYRGDQDLFGDHLSMGQTLPLQWFIKLKDCWEKGPPPGVKVIFGHPKPLWNRATDQKWVQELLK